MPEKQKLAAEGRRKLSDEQRANNGKFGALLIGLLPTIRDEAELQCRARLLAARDTATRALGRWNDCTPEQRTLYGTAALTACRYATAPMPTEVLEVAVMACRQMLMAARNLKILESYQ